MERTTTNVVYIAFLIAMTFIIPGLLLFGTGWAVEGIFAAVLSFGVMASYVVYTVLLGARNS